MDNIINFLPNLHNMIEIYDIEDIKTSLKLLNNKSISILNLIISSNENQIIKKDLLYMLINCIMTSKQKTNTKMINSIIWLHLKNWCFKLNIDVEI